MFACFSLLQVFTCESSIHLLRWERNAATVMLSFMSGTLSFSTRRPTKTRSVSSVISVTIAADRFVESGIWDVYKTYSYLAINPFIWSRLGAPHDNAQAHTHRGEAICLQPVWENVQTEAASGYALQALPRSQLCPHCLCVQQVQ